MLSICQWINEGNKDYSIISDKQIIVSLLNIQWALDYHIEDVAETCSNIYIRLAQDIQLIDGFEKSHILSIISQTLQTLSNINIVQIGSCRPNDYTYSPQFGHAFVCKFIGSSSMFIPFTPSGKYDEKKEDFCMDYAINTQTKVILKLIIKQ